MRLVSFLRDGHASYGRVVDGGVIDCQRLDGWLPTTIRQVLEADALADLRDRTEELEPDLGADDYQLLPPIPDPGKVLCAGVNYRTHRDETSLSASEHPIIFTRFADSQVAHDQALIKPGETLKFDYEGELAVVIGKAGRRIQESDAQAHIAGYACYNDGSVRDWQRHTTQWIPGKNFPATGGFGPELVTADEVPDVAALTLTTTVNGEIRQQASLKDLIFDIPTLISYISTFTYLRPGDVIVTGTPGGVGMFREPPTFLENGDVVEVEVTGIGKLVNAVAGDID